MAPTDPQENEMRIHHATTKSLAAAGLAAAAHPTEEGMAQITMDGVVIITGPADTIKDMARKAIDTVEDEGFDLDDLRAEQDGDDEDTGSEEQDAEDEAGEDEAAGSVVAAKYRARYKEIGANDSNGDAIAKAMRDAITIQGEKKNETSADIAAMEKIARDNGIEMPQNGRNPGHTRMILGNVLRGLLRRGTDLVIGDTTIPASAEAKAKRAERDEAAQKRADAESARAAKTPDEKRAEKTEKAKARRQRKAAEKRAAAEPTPAETAPPTE